MPDSPVPEPVPFVKPATATIYVVAALVVVVAFICAAVILQIFQPTVDHTAWLTLLVGLLTPLLAGIAVVVNKANEVHELVDGKMAALNEIKLLVGKNQGYREGVDAQQLNEETRRLREAEAAKRLADETQLRRGVQVVQPVREEQIVAAEVPPAASTEKK